MLILKLPEASQTRPTGPAPLLLELSSLACYTIADVTVVAMRRVLTPLGYEFWVDEHNAVWTSVLTYSRLVGLSRARIEDRLSGLAVDKISENKVCEWIIVDNPELARFVLIKGYREFVANMPALIEVPDFAHNDEQLDNILRYALKHGTITSWEVQDSGQFGDMTATEIANIFRTLASRGCGDFDEKGQPAECTP